MRDLEEMNAAANAESPSVEEPTSIVDSAPDADETDRSVE
jgi:hypothetical protein